jgi:hypothetical protein
MPTSRRSLRLLPHEDKLLRTLYRQFNIPTDQYPLRPDELTRLVHMWNSLTGRNESAPDLLHYMVTRRKKSQWERLGRNAGRDFSPLQVPLTDEDLKQLDEIHEELQIASDNYALDPEAGQRLQREFARRTGRVVPPMILAAAMITRRKAGALATLRPKSDEGDLGFSDINQVGD